VTSPDKFDALGKPADKKYLDISCQCPTCLSRNAKAWLREGDTFDAICDDCEAQFSFKLPGMGQLFV
jgi:hypothetical protein